MESVIFDEELFHVVVGDELGSMKDDFNFGGALGFEGVHKLVIILNEVLFKILKYFIQKYKLFRVLIFLKNEEVLE